MSKSSGESQPNFEVQPLPAGGEAAKEQAMEKRPADENAVGKKQADFGSASPPPTPPPSITIPVTDGTTGKGASESGALTDDLPADDVDLIEKQWVERAKAIVSRTQNDPYIQKKEISKAGADYIKKRFNKSIPTDDAVRT